MATRLCFISKADNTFYEEKEIEFEFFNGFALSQKQKSINSLHSSINILFPNAKILEVSRKSQNPIGNELSAFNLKMYNKEFDKPIPIECIFQSSKVFSNGNQYKDLLLVEPIDAKQDSRLKNSGNIVSFNYENTVFPNIPRTLFYDWIYINALYQSKDLLDRISQYEIFTDIEFNQNKSLNCQARSCAIARSLYKQNLLDEYLDNIEKFKSIYKNEDIKLEQISFF